MQNADEFSGSEIEDDIDTKDENDNPDQDDDFLENNDDDEYENKKIEDNRSRLKKRSKKKHGAKIRKKRKHLSSFLDIEAQVGDEDEEEEDEDGAFGDESREAEAARLMFGLDSGRKITSAKRLNEDHREEARRGGAGHLESAIDKIARKYQEQPLDEDVDEDDDYLLDDTEPMDYNQQEEPGALLPDVSDPKLWIIKVSRAGVPDIERTLAIAIEKKFFSLGGKASDFGIQSVYVSSHLKGYIYVESESQYKVKEALKGFRHVNLAGELKMVPIKDMPSVFNVCANERQMLRRGDFVRVKRGIYGGDLAQVYEIDDQEVYVTLRLVPRIDITAILEKEQNGVFSAGSGGKKKKTRPFKKFFDRDEVDARGGTIEQGHIPETVRFAGMLFEDSGHILRRANINHLIICEDVNADLSEIKEFKPKIDENEAGDDYNSGMWISVKKCLSMYRVGESVQIIKGDLAGITGKILKVGDSEVTVSTDFPTKKVVVVPQNQIMKKFSIGENVRALKGVNKGDTGLITHIDVEKKCASVFAFFSKQMFTCLLECLTVAPGDGIGLGGLGCINGFKLGDLLQLSMGQVGILCYIDRNKFVRVLTGDGTAVNVDVSQIACKRSSFDVWAKDYNGVKIGVKSNVTVVSGNNRGKSGWIVHIWRSSVFIKVLEKLEDGGYIVADARMCKASGNDTIFQQSNLNMLKAISNEQSNNLNGRNDKNDSSGGPKKLRSFGGRNRGGSFHGGGGGYWHREKYTGKLVRVIRGKYKGLIATIRRVDSSNNVEILFQCREQLVKIPKSDVQILETASDYIGNYPENKNSAFSTSRKHSFFNPPAKLTVDE